MEKTYSYPVAEGSRVVKTFSTDAGNIDHGGFDPEASDNMHIALESQLYSAS